MKIFVGGSIKKVEMYPDTCVSFVRRLGESIVERGHVLMTGCRGSLARTCHIIGARGAGQSAWQLVVDHDGSIVPVLTACFLASSSLS
ncbi:MAG TPA: hypothetical protein VLC48_05900 [Gemmatimonadota bacterium]|nr:hypothetical protein [Gemmatimonadota bacterium]